MRRLLIEEPVSRAAIWSRRIGLFAWLALAVSLGLARFGRLQPFETVATVIACGALALVALLLSVVAFTQTWRSGARGAGSALAGLVLSVALVAYPGVVCLMDVLDPRPLDITTDPANPPQPDARLSATRTQAPVAATTLDAGRPKNLASLLVDRPLDETLTAALRAAGLNSWRVTTVDYAQPPARDEARFAAVVPSFLIRWPSDAVVRLLETEDGVRVDVRLMARQRWSLLHGSAADISAYFERLEELVLAKPPHTGR